MTTREYLGQIKGIDNSIANKAKLAQIWHDRAFSLGSFNTTSEKVKTSPSNHNRMEDAIDKSVDYEREYLSDIERLSELYHTITEQIIGLETLGHKDASNILFMYYVKGDSLSKISGVIDRSWKQTKRNYNKAINVFEKAYHESYENL